eukprot:TRINITY_DN6606_c0_g1_i1.p1 TRINITY_DN6606_c0_g1~~TRINITY_DN6606_c0_g1_i1.p1  ORF type:complete len:644 (+),score=120.28 TRINITY_DN6606_c0_g1_i1:56-1987(+)
MVRAPRSGDLIEKKMIAKEEPSDPAAHVQHGACEAVVESLAGMELIRQVAAADVRSHACGRQDGEIPQHVLAALARTEVVSCLARHAEMARIDGTTVASRQPRQQQGPPRQRGLAPAGRARQTWRPQENVQQSMQFSCQTDTSWRTLRRRQVQPEEIKHTDVIVAGSAATSKHHRRSQPAVCSVGIEIEPAVVTLEGLESSFSALEEKLQALSGRELAEATGSLAVELLTGWDKEVLELERRLDETPAAALARCSPSCRFGNEEEAFARKKSCMSRAGALREQLQRLIAFGGKLVDGLSAVVCPAREADEVGDTAHGHSEAVVEEKHPAEEEDSEKYDDPYEDADEDDDDDDDSVAEAEDPPAIVTTTEEPPFAVIEAVVAAVDTADDPHEVAAVVETEVVLPEAPPATQIAGDADKGNSRIAQDASKAKESQETEDSAQVSPCPPSRRTVLLGCLRELFLDLASLLDWYPSSEAEQLAKAELLSEQLPRLQSVFVDAIVDAVLLDTAAELTRLDIVRELRRTASTKWSPFYRETVVQEPLLSPAVAHEVVSTVVPSPAHLAACVEVPPSDSALTESASPVVASERPVAKPRLQELLPHVVDGPLEDVSLFVAQCARLEDELCHRYGVSDISGDVAWNASAPF